MKPFPTLKKRSFLGRYVAKKIKTKVQYTIQGRKKMSKRELIDCICEINKSASPEFLAAFPKEDLQAYLEHLMELDFEELVLCG
jgi:hypothetical protein